MLMGADIAAIKEGERAIKPVSMRRFRLHGRQNPLPDPRLAPTAEATVDRLPVPIALRQIAPRCIGAQHPHDPVEHPSMVQIRAAGVGALRWQERRYPLPLLVTEFMPSLYMHALTVLRFANRP